VTDTRPYKPHIYIEATPEIKRDLEAAAWCARRMAQQLTRRRKPEEVVAWYRSLAIRLEARARRIPMESKDARTRNGAYPLPHNDRRRGLGKGRG